MNRKVDLFDSTYRHFEAAVLARIRHKTFGESPRKGSEVDQRFIDLYDEYTHAPLDRRVFLARLAALTGSAAAAAALLPLLEANPARAAVVLPEDPRLEAGKILYPGRAASGGAGDETAGGGDVGAYMARPKGAAKLPAVVVIHENRGLNAHIEDVARRVALAGFLAMAPDLLSSAGGTPADPDSARTLIGKLSTQQTLENLLAALAFLEKHSHANGKVGAMGFCWGGGMVGELAVAAPGLDAAIVYYGRQPATADVEKIAAPLLLHYAGLDSRINAGIAAFEAALQKAHKKYTLHVYDGVNHAFNNDTSAARYDKQAAELSWSRTIAFLREHLKA